MKAISWIERAQNGTWKRGRLIPSWREAVLESPVDAESNQVISNDPG